MKIGLICPYNMSRGGAVIEIVKDMQVGLSKRGHDVKIITGRPKDTSGMDLSNTLFVGTVADVRLPSHTLGSFTRSPDAEAVTRLLEHEQFDVLHFHEPGVPMLGKQILENYDGPSIATFHAKLPDALISQTIAKAATPYLRSVLDGIDELVVGSEAAAHFIRNLTDRPLHHITNGVDLETFRPVKRAAPGARKKILFVGRLEHRKGVKYLLDAFALLSQGRDDVELIIAGSGPDRKKLEAQAAELGLRNVSFLGFVDNATKLQLLAEADLYCSPALFGESFGLVLLEAMAVGLVTVAGHNPGYAAVMQGRGALSLVNPYDAPDFARRLALLLDDEDLRSMWRKWALEYVKQFDYRDIMAQYETLYERAIKEHSHKNNRTPAYSLVP